MAKKKRRKKVKIIVYRDCNYFDSKQSVRSSSMLLSINNLGTLVVWRNKWSVSSYFHHWQSHCVCRWPKIRRRSHSSYAIYYPWYVWSWNPSFDCDFLLVFVFLSGGGGGRETLNYRKHHLHVQNQVKETFTLGTQKCSHPTHTDSLANNNFHKQIFFQYPRLSKNNFEREPAFSEHWHYRRLTSRRRYPRRFNRRGSSSLFASELLAYIIYTAPL